MGDFRRLLAFSRAHAGWIGLAILCMFLSAGLSAVSIGALQPIFDLLFPSGNRDGIARQLGFPLAPFRFHGGFLDRFRHDG